MKCKICGQHFKKLYGGMCASCISLKTREASALNEAEQNKTTYSSMTDREKELIKQPGGFAKLVSSPEEKEAIARRAALAEQQKDKNSDNENEPEIDLFETMVVGGMSSTDKKAFMPTLKMMFRKYSYNFLRGKYKVCKKSQFGEDGIGGNIIESKAGLVIFELNKNDIEHVLPNINSEPGTTLDLEDNTIDLADELN